MPERERLLAEKVDRCQLRYEYLNSQNSNPLGMIFWLVATQIFFYFHSYLGKIPNLTNIFQMVWNHQLVLCYFEMVTPAPK